MSAGNVASAPRLNLHASAPESVEEMMSLEEFIGSRTLDPAFVELLRTYVSQLNRSAYGIDRYTHRAHTLGEPHERLRLLLSWRHTPLYSGRERAAFAWTDSVLRPGAEPGDGDFREAREWFSEDELADLTFVIVMTHAWNRLAGAFGQPPTLGLPDPRG